MVISGQLELERIPPERSNPSGTECLRIRFVLRRLRVGPGVVGSATFADNRISYSLALALAEVEWLVGKNDDADEPYGSRSRSRVSLCALWRHTRTIMIVG